MLKSTIFPWCCVGERRFHMYDKILPYTGYTGYIPDTTRNQGIFGYLNNKCY